MHESGHAIAGWFLKYADPLLKVSILPRSKGALGFAQVLPSEDGLLVREVFLDRIATLLAGRAAEDLFIGKISSGAQDDLRKVTETAYEMVSRLGMNHELGLVGFEKEENQFIKPYCEETGQIIDSEVRELVAQQYARVKEFLNKKNDLLTALSDRLLEKETLVFAELKEILGEPPHAVTGENMKFVDQANPFEMEETSE